MLVCYMIGNTQQVWTFLWTMSAIVALLIFAVRMECYDNTYILTVYTHKKLHNGKQRGYHKMQDDTWYHPYVYKW